MSLLDAREFRPWRAGKGLACKERNRDFQILQLPRNHVNAWRSNASPFVYAGSPWAIRTRWIGQAGMRIEGSSGLR
jgi:hypothetical protein